MLERGAEPDRSQSSPLRLVEDRGQRFDGLTAVAAAPGTVAVVKEQRYARPEVPAGARGDRRYARLGRIEDAAVPAANAIAEPAGGVDEPGAAYAVRRAKQRNRGPIRGRGDRLLGRHQLRAHPGWGAEGEQAVVEPMACDLVAVREYLPEHLGVFARVSAEDEEGRAMTALAQQSADRRREAGVRAVVEGERELAGFVTRPCRSPEQRNSRCERAEQVEARRHATDEREQNACAEQPVEDGSSSHQRKSKETARKPSAESAHR